MNGSTAVFEEMSQMQDIRLLSEEEMVSVSGGLDPITIGIILAAAGGVLVVTGVVVGTVMYALAN
jgi:lactobin A/cerein 7B family class IIb bacteriocin